ncbi:MAG: sucrose-6-phosphate hydrolase, partial [Lachnospiraceae bacterium]|nr:sucrose-6-phosphate hydrolase [Lachnospiraceae bacterium]
MVVFNVDMDNTLIYSYKHDIGESKRCAEIYQGREISFMTDKTSKLLRELARKVLIVPTTTRTRQQYERIDLGLGKIPYALVCNGGVLIKDGVEVEDWYAGSKALI